MSAAIYAAVGVGAAYCCWCGRCLTNCCWCGRCLINCCWCGCCPLCCCLADDAFCLAVSVNAYISTTYGRDTAAMFLPPYIFDVPSVSFRPHTPPHIDLPQVVSSGDEDGLSRRLRSSARSRPDGYDSDRSLRSGFHDSEQRDFARKEAADGGTSAGSPEHQSTSPEPRTNQLGEDS